LSQIEPADPRLWGARHGWGYARLFEEGEGKRPRQGTSESASSWSLAFERKPFRRDRFWQPNSHFSLAVCLDILTANAQPQLATGFVKREHR
jgi:hypothetical protein